MKSPISDNRRERNEHLRERLYSVWAGAGEAERRQGGTHLSKIAVHNKEEYAAIQAAREAAEAALNGEDQF